MSNTKISDPKQLTKLISFMATFDGGLYVHRKPNSVSNARFILNMRAENRDYIEWVAEVVGNITDVSIKERKDYNTDGYKRKPQLRLESKVHPRLTKIRNRLYTPDNKKVIDLHMLKLLDAQSLAIIFMCDGGTILDTRFKRPHGSIALHTKGFSEADNLALSKAIYEKLDIKTNVNRHYNYFLLRVPVKEHQKFIDTVKSYVLPSFKYKLERLAPIYDIG